MFFDNIPVWLTASDWTARAEIKILEQTRIPEVNQLTGKFRAEHLYSGEEQKSVTKMFRRMFSFPGEFDPYFYLLESREIYDAAVETGFLVRHDLVDEGFMHASPANQLTRVANKHYREIEDVVCALVAKERVLAPIKYEPATAGIYPHIFGPLNMDAVDRVLTIKRNQEGQFDIDIPKLLAEENQDG
jgi:uncharacterized protein (DUF952 family)